MKDLIGAYLSWCDLLRLRVTKVQLWTNGAPCSITVKGVTMQSSPTFCIVGIVLGQHEKLATNVNATPG